ncbi:flagellar assembly protein FliW [Paenibacillus dokdonensis]|uniref:Flagellar assembly factor FliW n=1 Tax=Paenibacillus dokdonensis TaxID=2567944 RepID=A0ABU6GTB8_9BACL|nr:flagellar assembly protein FliW [Paenibacillus dokdonensis]MEC0241417.1 flagellar assembly protein FliW [Paenibacillus dokdonensis]
MIIKTSSWGDLEIAEDQVYHFPKGIPAFEEETEFAVISLEEGRFHYLQSTKEQELAFLLADPFDYYPQYEFELPPADTEELQIDKQVNVRCVISLKEKLELSTINLLAPVILNPDKRLGKQIVLHNSHYQTRHPLWSESGTESSVKAGE